MSILRLTEKKNNLMDLLAIFSFPIFFCPLTPFFHINFRRFFFNRLDVTFVPVVVVIVVSSLSIIIVIVIVASNSRDLN